MGRQGRAREKEWLALPPWNPSTLKPTRSARTKTTHLLTPPRPRDPPDGAGYIDPPSVAAFAIIRIDELMPGETEAEIGRRRSDEPAKFRTEIPVLPNPVKLGHELTQI